MLVEKEVFEAKKKTRASILEQFGQTDFNAATVDDAAPAAASNVTRLPTDATRVGYFPPIVYDEKGRPRPAVIGYDSSHSDDPSPAPSAAGDLRRTGTVDADDDEADIIRFPGLDPPVG